MGNLYLSRSGEACLYHKGEGRQYNMHYFTSDEVVPGSRLRFRSVMHWACSLLNRRINTGRAFETSTKSCDRARYRHTLGLMCSAKSQASRTGQTCLGSSQSNVDECKHFWQACHSIVVECGTKRQHLRASQQTEMRLSLSGKDWVRVCGPDLGVATATDQLVRSLVGGPLLRSISPQCRPSPSATRLS